MGHPVPDNPSGFPLRNVPRENALRPLLIVHVGVDAVGQRLVDTVSNSQSINNLVRYQKSQTEVIRQTVSNIRLWTTFAVIFVHVWVNALGQRFVLCPSPLCQLVNHSRFILLIALCLNPTSRSLSSWCCPSLGWKLVRFTCKLPKINELIVRKKFSRKKQL